MAEDTQYLGDGVYASHDGYHIWLRADREGRTHQIALDPDVLTRLNAYRTRLLGQPTLESPPESPL